MSLVLTRTEHLHALVLLLLLLVHHVALASEPWHHVGVEHEDGGGLLRALHDHLTLQFGHHGEALCAVGSARHVPGVGRLVPVEGDKCGNGVDEHPDGDEVVPEHHIEIYSDPADREGLKKPEDAPH